MKPHARTLAAAVVLVLALSLPVPPPARAATLTVTDCGDSGGSGQLRHLIGIAGPGDTIMVPACTITLTVAAGGPLAINKNLTISGVGPPQTIIDGQRATQVVNVAGGTVTITRVTIRNGSSNNPGGGIANVGALTLSDVMVTGNSSGNSAMGIQSSGGGITNEGGGTLTLRNVTVSDNVSNLNGGGIFTIGGALTLTNSTVSGNTADGGGGGIWKGGVAGATLTNVTIAHNRADNTNACCSADGGGLQINVGAVAARNTILAGNTVGTSGSGPDCAGTLTSQGHNLIQDPTGCTIMGTSTGNLTGVDPLLGPLQNNGGPTPTQALLPGSPAIDAGDNAGCPSTDQRGVPRPLDATSSGFTVCDIGAFEVETLGFIHASLALNTASVRPGTLLQGTVTVANDGGARPLDVYVAVALPAAAGPGVGCPSGDAVAFLTGSGATLTCVSSGVQTFAPFLTNVSLPADLFTPVSAPLFSLVWPAGAPLGPYTVAFVLTPVGAFSDGRVNPTAGIVIATAGFSATP